jgi:hypothetical protein
VVNTPDSINYSDADLQEAITHHDSALAVIHPITDALTLIPSLCVEIRHLRWRLASTLTDHQDLIAAGKATLGAYADAEPDPLYYLRDQLQALGYLRQDRQDTEQRGSGHE